MDTCLNFSFSPDPEMQNAPYFHPSMWSFCLLESEKKSKIPSGTPRSHSQIGVNEVRNK
ncbi:hypothetical protein NEPTK9_000828 [Candidatus Neptunochlamydia vexilliferae]|uniref:Uncharacterized protein n=1 Tax=Candidatus Neptunichlamydia vexilliferae TaxID=1651774 RepID=A0ABS0AYW7_9BACT|nr:hypothetical protein [Candidatus Neptunochlamydia vexilliferae]